MSDSLIEQVRKLADSGLQYAGPWRFDFAKLLAHLEHTQAVVDAAREWRRIQQAHAALISTGNGRGEAGLGIGQWAAMHNEEIAARDALDAALEKVKS